MKNVDYFTWRGAVLKSSLPSSARLVLHTLGCHMNDAGESCFPSIETLCSETGLSKPTVISCLKAAEDAGFIEVSKHGYAGKKWARNEYKATFPPAKNEPEINDEIANKAVKQFNHLNNEGGKATLPKAVKPFNSNYPSNYPVVFTTNVEKTTPREKEKTVSENSPARPEGLLACRLIKLNVAVTSINPILCKWVTDKISVDLIEQCVQLARQNKPWPEKIAAGYLDAIIRNELKPKTDNSWLMTDEGTIAKGREIGIDAHAGESMNDYRQRLKNHLTMNNQKAA